ncbi:MAG: DUF3099 domain-containing protein [Micrococcales bacterium]
MAEPQSVTNLGTAPEVERRSRMIRYSIAMAVRMVCIVLAIVVQGWLMWVCFALAIVLPYWAVVIANSRGDSKPKTKAEQVVAPRLAISADAFKIPEDHAK